MKITCFAACSAVAALLVCVGCSKRAAPPAETLPTSVHTAANAAIPKDAEAWLTFETVKFQDEERSYVVAVPKGWTPRNPASPDTFRPSDDSLGFMTHLSFGRECDGMCTSKDWAPIAAKKSRQAVPDSPQVTEQVTATSHLRVGPVGAKTAIYFARWQPQGADAYVCTATLDGKTSAAHQAFVAACTHSHVQ